MSAGAFINGFYESNNGRIYRAKLQPETAALVIGGVTNVVPAGPATEEISATLGSGNDRGRMYARSVTVAFTGAIPSGYSGDPVRVPLLTPAPFNAAVPGAAGTYLGESVTVVGRRAERSS